MITKKEIVEFEQAVTEATDLRRHLGRIADGPHRALPAPPTIQPEDEYVRFIDDFESPVSPTD